MSIWGPSMPQEPEYGEPPLEKPTEEEERWEAWEYWHERALKAEALNKHMTEALCDIEFVVDGKEDIDNNGGPNDAMKIGAVVATTLRRVTCAKS